MQFPKDSVDGRSAQRVNAGRRAVSVKAAREATPRLTGRRAGSVGSAPPRRPTRALRRAWSAAPHDDCHPGRGQRGACQREHRDALPEQRPGQDGRGGRHQVEQARHRGGRPALDQQVKQRAAAQREAEHRPAHGTDQLRIEAVPGVQPMHGLGFHQCQRQRDDEGRRQLHEIGAAHVARRQVPLLVERAGRDAQQRDRRTGQVACVDLTLPELGPDHEHQPAQPEGEPAPLGGAHTVAAPGEPYGREHRLQADQQRREARAHAELDGRPHAAQVDAVHQDARDRKMQPLPRRLRPAGARQARPQGEDAHGECIAHGEELHRRRMRHAEARHDEAGAPDEHEDERHRAHQGARGCIRDGRLKRHEGQSVDQRKGRRLSPALAIGAAARAMSSKR